MDWEQMRLVLALGRAGTLAGAGRALGLDPATVSRQLARAEAASGRRLFDRLPDGMAATGAGRLVMARAEAMEAEAAALGRDLAAEDPEEAGELRVTIPPLLAACGLAEDLAALAARHPRIELTVLADARTLNLHRREADLAIRIGETPAPSLWGRVVARQRAGLFLSPALAADLGEAIAARAPLPVIAFTGWGEPMPAALLARHPGSRIAVRTDDLATALALAGAGMGVLRMPHILLRREPSLRRLPGVPPEPYPPVWALTHPDLRRAPRVRIALDLLGRALAARAADFLGPDMDSAAASD